MFNTLPQKLDDFMAWPWERIAPYFDDLLARDLTAETAHDWLTDWTCLSVLLEETEARLWVATTVNTADEEAEQHFHAFVEHIKPQMQTADQRVKEKLLASGLEPDGFEIPLRNMRADTELFQEKNLPLFTEEEKLVTAYDQLMGGITVDWDGEEKTLQQLTPFLFDPDRVLRERAWRARTDRLLQDKERFDDLWQQFMDLRKQIAANAGFESYRDYRWKYLKRFEYTPDDAIQFQNAIETVVVPALTDIYQRRKTRLGIDTLRPWDTRVDPQNRPPLRPFEDADTLINTTSNIFHRLDPQLAGYFDTLRDEQLLDLGNRKHKAPGGYHTALAFSRRSFIFMNAVGMHFNVVTLLHEAGHAFHAYERAAQPYYHQRRSPMEFNETASMAMELLAMPYITKDQGGFYDEADAARAQVDHLVSAMLSWLSLAEIDAFQHWIYTHHDEARDPAACDAKELELTLRFNPGIDYSGLEREAGARWRSIWHLFGAPFYVIEYAFSQLGAVQIWANAQQNQAGALAAYRRALALGGTRPLPELYAAAGARLAFDADTLREAVDLMVQKIDELDPA